MIYIQNLHYEVNGQCILKDIQLDIKQNTIYGIIGPNGAGKSTLLKHIMGVIKVPPNTIFIEGKDISDFSPKDYAKKCSLVFQENMKNLDFTVEEIISMGRYAYLDFFGSMNTQDKSIVSKLITSFSLEALRNRPLRTLSGGEAQKVFIARALAQEAPILLLDEPTSMLDVHSGVELLGVLKKVQQKYNLTIVLVMHDLNLAFQFCENIILLNHGNIISKGTSKHVLYTKELKEVYNNKLQLIQYSNRTYIVPQVDGFATDII